MAWKHTARRRLFEQFLFPVTAMVVTTAAVGILLPRWRVRSPLLMDSLQIPLSLICFGLVAFTIASVLQEFFRGAQARRRNTGLDWLTSTVGIVMSKRRKYGGYIVHLGVALMFIGFAGKAATIERQVTLQTEGETFVVGPYTFHYDEFVVKPDNSAFVEFGAKVTVMQGNDVVTSMYPARREYRARKDEQMTTEVAIDRRLAHDIYLVLNSFEPDTQIVNLSTYLNPLVNWVWFGFGLLAFGTGICLMPGGAQVASRRT